MTDTIRLRRSTGAETFDDGQLRRIAATLKERDPSACFAAVPYELHAYAAQCLIVEAKRACVGAPEKYDDAMRLARQSLPHLAYLAMCQFHDDARVDVEITAGAGHD